MYHIGGSGSSRDSLEAETETPVLGQLNNRNTGWPLKPPLHWNYPPSKGKISIYLQLASNPTCQLHQGSNLNAGFQGTQPPKLKLVVMLSEFGLQLQVAPDFPALPRSLLAAGHCCHCPCHRKANLTCGALLAGGVRGLPQEQVHHGGRIRYFQRCLALPVALMRIPSIMQQQFHHLKRETEA